MHKLSNFLKGNKTDLTYKKEKAGAQNATHPATHHKFGKFRKKGVFVNPKLMETMEIENKKAARNLEEKELDLFSKNKTVPTRIPIIPTTKTNKKFQSVFCSIDLN